MRRGSVKISETIERKKEWLNKSAMASFREVS